MTDYYRDMMTIKTELKRLISLIKDLDRKVVVIFLSVGILQSISWYFTSRRYFHQFLFNQFEHFQDVFLIEFLYWFIGDFLVFFGLTILIIKFILQKDLKDFGLRIGDYRTGLKLSVIFFLFMIPIIWFFSATPDFSEKYPLLFTVRSSWSKFIIFELGLLVYMIGWEFVWRGFMLFGLEEKFGFYSVLIQMIPFVILHNGKPFFETIGAIPGGIALGILALRTRSIYYCVITHISIMILIDLISTLRYRAQDYGTGISSLINLFNVFF